MPKIILITHQKGGVGKSTLTFNLAVNLVDNAKVCIVDMDYQGSLNKVRELSKVPVLTADQLSETAKSDYDFIFIDTPPYLTDKFSELCQMADIILIPTKAGVFDLLAINSTIDMIKAEKCENKAVIVFNMVKPNTTMTKEIQDQLKEYGIKVAKTMISDLVAFTRSSVLNGVEDNNRAQKQIDNLTKEVLTLTLNKNG